MRGSRNRWHPRCGFCGLTLTVETGWKEVNVDIFECQKEIYLCRVRMQKRIVDLEAEIKGILDKEDQRLKNGAVNARVEALREVRLWCQHQRTGWRSEATDLMMEILSMLDGLIAEAKQPAPTAGQEE